MFQVYTSTDKSELSKNLIGEFKDWDEAMDCAEQAIEGKKGIRYIVEETNGIVNSYGFHRGVNVVINYLIGN